MRKGFVLVTLVALLALVCIAAPAAFAAPAAPQAAKAWTVMVYIDGDNNLEGYVVKDIETELSALGSNANVNVVCIADRGPGYDTSRGDWQTTKVYFCTQGMLADAASAVADWGERDMGDPRTLKDFVTWAKSSYPATNYLLAFWDHGYMWMPNAYNFKDDTSGSTLDDDEQVAAMQTAGPVGVVAWDCCQRQMIEMAANWQPYAKAMAGSESYTNWEGIQYDAVIAAIRSTPALTPQQVSDKIASTALGDSDTYSSVALDTRLTTTLTALDQLAIAMKNALPVYRSAYTAARRATQLYSGNIELDLWHLAYNVKAKVADAVIKAKCDALMSAVAADVTVNWISASKQVKNSHGLAIWWPATASGLNPYAPTDFAYYRQMKISTLPSWDEFLAAFCQ
ncbi:MAG: clostripain-related cysteine peptidase [Actinomycetes bacterium]